jgi:NitT/TauT family transport system ATP-binding protein
VSPIVESADVAAPSPRGGTAAVAFHGVGVDFRASDGTRYQAVKDLTLSFRHGEFVAMVGPTGCGKSTLLNLVSGILEPTSGDVQVFGRPIAGIGRGVGYMFQNEALLPWLTARDNVALGLKFRRQATASAAARAEEWLARVGLAGFGNRFPHQLSGGMRKRVALAQMMIMDPKILLMDEPFSALDVQTRQLMENELLDIWATDRRTVIFVTHDLEEAICLADRVVVLSAGPGTTPVAEFGVDIPRPRDVTEIVHSPHYAEIHAKIWSTLKAEVLKSYRRRNAGPQP